MEKARTMENKPYGWNQPLEAPNKPASPSTSKATPHDSSETLVPTTTNDAASSLSASGEERKEPLSALERIKLEREHEKANPKEPLKPAEGIWKSRWMVVPAAILFGFGGG